MSTAEVIELDDFRGDEPEATEPPAESPESDQLIQIEGWTTSEPIRFLDDNTMPVGQVMVTLAHPVEVNDEDEVTEFMVQVKGGLVDFMLLGMGVGTHCTAEGESFAQIDQAGNVLYWVAASVVGVIKDNDAS